MKITVNKELCTRCLRCVRECPSEIFSLRDKAIALSGEGRCIACGHCAGVCEVGAVRHELFPEERVHPIDSSLLPSPEQVMLLIASRRSNRSYSKDSVPQEYLDLIVEAAHRAPTASNLQGVSFTLVTDPEKIRLVCAFTLDTFGRLAGLVDKPLVKPIAKRLFPQEYRYIRRFRSMQRAFGAGKDYILRGATALLFIHTSPAIRYGSEDSNLAYQNASLMAESLGIAQFYTGFVLSAARRRKGVLERLLGIEGKIHAGMALGMPLFRYANYIDRKEAVVKHI